MGNLLTSLANAASSMDVFEKALAVVSNNVTNAKTAGYVKQDINLVAQPMDIALGLSGGVTTGMPINSRQGFLEQAVFNQAQRLGNLAQQRSSLEQIEPIFDIAQQSGISSAMDRLFQSFAQWSVNPNDQPVRQGVLRAAGGVADAFQNASTALGRAASQSDVEMRSSIDAVNRIAEQLQKLNQELRTDSRRQQDAGVEAQVYSMLEELSDHVDFQLMKGADGTFSVYLGGQTPLTLGTQAFPIQGDFSGAAPVIRDVNGKDISGQIQQGKLRGLLDIRGTLLPGVLTDLNHLAETLADRVNETLLAGVDKNGEIPSRNLFTYNTTRGTAATLEVTDIQPDQLAAAVPEAPGGNANAMNLAALAGTREVDDFTFSQYYGEIAGGVGRVLANAKSDEQTQTLLVTQAQQMRSDASSVSLDEEALKMIEFQRCYQAAAQLVRVLDTLTDSTMSILK